MTWEYATLGWYVDDNRRRAVYYWRIAGTEPEEFNTSSAFNSQLAQAGQDGWELVSAASAPTGETLYFKRPIH